MAADRTAELVVLRADRLTPGGWSELLALSRATGARLTLVCHTPKIPTRLVAVLGGVGHQLLTDLTQLGLPPSSNVVGLLADDGAPADGPDGVALPRFTYPTVTNYRIEAFTRLDTAGFARTDAVYRRAQAAAERWLDTTADPVDTARGRQAVTLFLTELVHDSPSRTHTLARLRGAQAAFRWHGLHLVVPASGLVLDILGGPGLTSVPFTADLASRVRAGAANPVLAAALALVLFTGMQPLALATLPWASLTPDNDALQLSWTGQYRQLLIPDPAVAQVSAMFHVPTAARALLQAARHFAQPSPDPSVAGRLFATIPFSNLQLAAAAANCKIPLGGQATDLAFTWQTRIGVERANGFGGPDDTRFAADQRFDPHGTRRGAAA